MRNRYATEVGAKGYDQIVSTNPANGPLRIVVAREIFWAMNKRPATVVDLGCGGGQSITPVISRCKGVRAEYILVDADQEMLEQAKINVPGSTNAQLICQDILAFLHEFKKTNSTIITSSLTIHNFQEAERRKILTSIANVLSKGGLFVWMDRIYPDVSEQEMWKMLQRQNSLFDYLPRDLSEKMQKHQLADHEIRMVEAPTLQLLESLGFKAKLKARVERDVVIVATKQ